MKVLVIDDDAAFRTVAKCAVAGMLDVSLQTEANGKDGLRRLLSEPFDLVLLDLKMAPMDGEEVYQEIKKHKIKTHVIIVTGVTEAADKLMAENPSLRVVSKQLKFREYQEALKYWILQTKGQNEKET